MNKTFKKMLVSGAAFALLGGVLAGCGGLKGDAGKATKDDDGKTLLMYQIGDKPENYDQLMEVANKRIKDKIGYKVNLQYIGWGDYEKKMSVITSSGENYDIALAKNYVANAQKGAYADLTDMLPKYAKESYDMLDEAYIQGNTVNGKLYAMPVNGNVYAQQVLSFNSTFLDKYNLDVSNVKTLADMEPMLQVIKEKEPNVVPVAAGSGWRVIRDIEYVMDDKVPLAVDIHGDTTKIINPYETGDGVIPDLKTMHKFYELGYVAKDAATSNTDYNLESDTWFARIETQGPYDYGDTLLTRAAQKPIVSRPITSPIKNTANARMANFVVSNNSKNKEKSVELLNLLNSDPELLNGLVYGIEDETWKKLDNDRVELLKAYGPKNHMSAWNTGNNEIVYLEKSITDEQIEKRKDSIENAEKSPLLGFNFVTDNVKTELTNINNVMSQYLDGLHTGTLDPDKALPEMNQKLNGAGLEKVRAEMQKQFDEFNKSKK